MDHDEEGNGTIQNCDHELIEDEGEEEGEVGKPSSYSYIYIERESWFVQLSVRLRSEPKPNGFGFCKLQP